MSCPESPHSQWSRQRREAAVARARLLQARQAAEHTKAERIVSAFMAQATRDGLSPRPLEVRGYHGGTARTPLSGWYLRSDRTVALGTDGAYYILTRSLSLRERLFGAAPPPPERVPLVIGEGGRDGDVTPLLVALEALSPGWRQRHPGSVT